MSWFVLLLLHVGVALAAFWALAIRALRRPVLLAEELALAGAMLFVAGGAVWLWAYLDQQSLAGFGPPWTWLTAAHFHVAGCGALVMAALCTRLVPQGKARSVMTTGLVAHPVAFSLTAAGIGGVAHFDVLGAGLYVVIFVVELVVMLTLPNKPRSKAYIALLLALCVPIGTLVPALTWALGIPILDLGSMVAYHGYANALGHVALGLASFAVLRPKPLLPRLSAPLSALSRRSLHSHSGIDSPGDDSHKIIGLSDDFGAYARPDFAPGELDPEIVAFYECTEAFDLDIQATWHVPFRMLGWCWSRGASRWLGQLGFPVTSDGQRVLDSRLFQISDDLDGRTSVRIWQRRWRDSGKTLYVAAYSEHVAEGTRYMNIAFPLPGCNLTSILHVSASRSGGLVLTSRHDEYFDGDQGVYLVRRRRPMRLPLDETITVHRNPQGSGLVARHEMWLLGINYLTLTYAIRRKPTRS